MRSLLLEHEPDRALPHLLGVPASSRHDCILSRVGVSGEAGAVDPKDNTNFGPAVPSVPENFAPGANDILRVQITAPRTAGTYNLQRQMEHNGVVFGTPSPNLV